MAFDFLHGRTAKLFLLQLELAGGFVFFEEFAELRHGVEEADPLFVIERDGKAAKTVDADAAFFADAEFEGAAAAAAALLFHFRDFCFEFFVSWFSHGVSSGGWSWSRIIQCVSIGGSARYTPARKCAG